MPFDTKDFLNKAGEGKRFLQLRKSDALFRQGDECDGMYYIQSGRFKISVNSRQGKEAIVAILGPRDFVGEGCLSNQTKAISSAVAMENCRVLKIERLLFQDVLHREPAFADLFLRYVLSRNTHFEEDLIDQLFNSSEKRLARILLLMARYGKEGEPEPRIPAITQASLAEMVGTTRARVSKFMNKFRDLGFIAYDRHITVYQSLLTVVLHDSSPHALTPARKKKAGKGQTAPSSSPARTHTESKKRR